MIVLTCESKLPYSEGRIIVEFSGHSRIAASIKLPLEAAERFELGRRYALDDLLRPVS